MKNFAHTTAVFSVCISAIIACPFRAQAEDARCTNASLQGSFGYLIVGSLVSASPVTGAFVEVGKQIFDGSGNTTATATGSINGSTLPPLTLGGTYTVNPDCTGTMTLYVSPVGITSHASFVITDGGKEFQAIITNPGNSVSVTGRKQFSE